MKKINPNGSRTLYVGGIYEVDKASGGSVTRTVTYYPVAGAMRINSTLYYTLKDHLGSASVVTDASGVEVGEQRYYPFGETRLTTGTIYTDKLFTGQREMAGLGIYHYQARFYSPKTGKFLSADTIVPGYANPQNLNRYSYVLNNPLKYIDPSGHIPIDCYNDSSYCSNTTTLHQGPTYSPKPKKPKRGDNEPGGTPPISAQCSVVFTACSHPTATSTPFPTITSTPTSTPTGPMYTDYSTPPQPYWDFDFYVDWSKVDYIDAGIDVIGLTADVTTLIPATAPVAAAAQPVVSVVEFIGLVKSGVELVRGDPSSMLYDQTMSQGERVIVMVARTERIVPVLGIFGSSVSLWINLKPQINAEWITP